MVGKVSVQCGGMKLTRERWMGLVLSGGAALLSVIPYIVAWRLAPETKAFNGFLINPIDGFTYLAKMRQGMEGYWSLTLPYAADPGPRAFLYVYYLLLGHVSRLTSIAPIWVFHIARFLSAIPLFYFAYLLNEKMSPHRNIRWFGFGLIVLGSGLGWMGLFFPSLKSSDVIVPESIPYLLAYSNAHFPLAAGALLAGILAVVSEGWRHWRRVIVAGLSGFILGAVLPFSFISLLAVLGIGLLVEFGFGAFPKPTRGDFRRSLNMGIGLLASSLGALPWLVYDYSLSIRHPVIMSWNAQNQTPSPSPLAYLLGFGPILILALIGLIRGNPWYSGKGHLLVVWLVSGAVLLYAPVSFQRRLSLGLAFPLCILAAWGWGSIPMRRKRRRMFFVLILVFVSLTNLLVITAGLVGVAQGDPAVVYLPGEVEGYRWIDEHTAPGSLVLAGERAGNRLPAFADARVLYGHPFETPNAEAQLALVEQLFRDGSTDLEDLQELGISWVYYGAEERIFAAPAWLGELKLRWQEGEYAIYEVPSG